jgi:hypothetical protein
MERHEGALERKVLWWTIPVAKLKGRRSPMRRHCVCRWSDVRLPWLGAVECHRFELAVAERRATGHVMQKAIGVAVWSHMPYAGTRPTGSGPACPSRIGPRMILRRTARTLLASLGCPSDVGEAILVTRCQHRGHL